MNKYRVKNCPAISFAGGCQNGEIKVWDCQDCTDCVMKQIVDICKHELTRGYDPLANIILSKLNIQEVE